MHGRNQVQGNLKKQNGKKIKAHRASRRQTLPRGGVAGRSSVGVETGWKEEVESRCVNREQRGGLVGGGSLGRGAKSLLAS